MIFKPQRVGDKVGVGCISDSCMNCNSKYIAVLYFCSYLAIASCIVLIVLRIITKMNYYA